MIDRQKWSPGLSAGYLRGIGRGHLGRKTFLVTCPIDLGSTMEVYLDGKKSPEELEQNRPGLGSG